MDEITHALKHARHHFNDSPVLSQWYLTWSHAYRADLYEDRLAQMLRRARRQDGRAVIPPATGCTARQREWRYLVFHSKVMWKRS